MVRHKMKKLETIRKEERRLRKFIKRNISLYSTNTEMREKLDQVFIAEAMLVWAMSNCKWTPSKWLELSKANKNVR